MSGREGSQAEVGAEEALLAPSQQYTQFLQWQAQQQEATPQYAVDGGSPQSATEIPVISIEGLLLGKAHVSVPTDVGSRIYDTAQHQPCPHN